MTKYKTECMKDGNKLSHTDDCKTEVHSETYTIVNNTIQRKIQ